MIARAVVRLAAAMLVPWVGAACPAKATPQSYPLIFSSPSQLRSYGITAEYGTPAAHFPYRCYYFGDGSIDVSISPQFLSRYQARGFSLHSLCLALQSPIRYDPETGQRLPTYTLVDGPAMLERSSAGEAVLEAGAISEELPLEVPDCFKTGTPYSNCRFSFDPSTGVRIDDAKARQIAVAGKMYEEAMEVAIRENKFCQLNRPCPRDTLGAEEGEELVRGRLAPEGYSACSVLMTHPKFSPSQAFFRYFGGTFYDVSPSLPKGFGYALFADGSASGESSPEAQWEGVKWFIDYYWRTRTTTGVPQDVQESLFFLAQGGGGLSVTANALSMLGERLAKGDSPVSKLVRQWQDLEAKRTALEWCTTGANFDAQAAGEEQDKILQQLEGAPGGWAFRDSQDVAQVQALLTAHEALVLYVPTSDSLFIWVVTKTASRWVRSELGTENLQKLVAALRCGLDYEGSWRADGSRCAELLKATYSAADYASSKLLPFDLERAYALYKALFDQVEDLTKDKHLLIVPSGALTQLPFQVLVTEKPDPGLQEPDAMRKAAWLAKSHAVTVLPSVSSLKALRQFPDNRHADRVMVGFGNPLLDGEPNKFPRDKDLALRARAKQACPEAISQQVASLEGAQRGMRVLVLRGGLANVAEIRSQVPLPETAAELCAVAHDLGVNGDEIRLGAEATEAEIKRLSQSGELAKYRIIHFATHGALAGQVSGDSEPGLLLTPPERATETDDGYLSASEVAGLKLDADWVILSACNTAAGGSESAEALSGLARAFFYAGARALLVSHWSVYSDATVKLITSAVRRMAADKSIGRAEAMRQSMLTMIDKGAPIEAHPAYWAPFVVVGEGAPAR